MACCLTAPSHYLNQCWLIISRVSWYSLSYEMLNISILDMRLKITYLKLQPYLKGFNDLNLRDVWLGQCRFEPSTYAVTGGFPHKWPLTGQGATPVRGAPGWLALNLVGGMREPPSGSIQLQKLQFQSVIYGNPEHSNWHQSFPTHIWLFLAQCGILAGVIKTMQAE